jgi:Tol biopolymer transport system component
MKSLLLILLFTILYCASIFSQYQELPFEGYHLQWSPDDQKIAFADWDDAAHMWIVTLADNLAFEVTPGVHGDYYISWLPNSEEVIFDAREAKGPPNLWRININETNPIKITDATSIMPTVSPDGNYVAFCNGNDIIKKSLIDNSEINLTNHSSFNYHPDWSADGTKILFTTDRNGNPDIYYAPSDGGTSVQVTFDAALDDRASWHPNSEDITFVSERSGTGSIYKINIYDLEPELLIEDASYPIWNSDGTKMAFAKSSGICIIDYSPTDILVKEKLKAPIKIFPNPFIDELNISSNDNDIYGFRLFDNKGALLFAERIDSFHKGESLKINSSIITKLESGIYFISINSNSYHFFQKIIKK